MGGGQSRPEPEPVTHEPAASGIGTDEGLDSTSADPATAPATTSVEPKDCANLIRVSGVPDGQGPLEGLYRKTATPQGGRFIYAKNDDDHFVYFWDEFNGWRIGPNYNAKYAGISSLKDDAPACPYMVTPGTWSVFDGESFQTASNVTVAIEANDELSWQEFYHDNFWVVGLLILTFMLFAVLSRIERRWTKRAKYAEHHSIVMKDAHTFSVDLVRKIMPTMVVEKYQFRGMRKRNMEVDIAFRDLALTLPSGAKVLEGVTGEFKAGKMCAIMGPSGAGKTTFLNVLCGKATYGTMDGEVLINGAPGDISSIKSLSGFVPQDDIVHEQLTVREQIRFSAELRNEVGISKRRLDNVTEDVLNVMQLLQVQGSIVGGQVVRGISGGQRKRVNVGLELASQPTVLFLDEPTSGLDSSSSLAVVLSLKKMCQLGMTSIMVIHQPRYSLFTLFSDVLLLGKGGRTVYLGPSQGAKVYFEGEGFRMPTDENPADWFMDVICGEIPNKEIADFKPAMLCNMWKKSAQTVASGSRSVASASVASLTTAAWLHTEERQMDDSDDRQVLADALSYEWEKMDTNCDGVLNSEKLKFLLAGLSRQIPSDEIVEELMERMSETPQSVTKEEFISYLLNLRHSIAADVMALSSVEVPVSRNLATTSGRSFDEVSSATETDSEDLSSEDGDDASLNGASPGGGRKVRLQRRLPGFWHQLRTLMRRSFVLFSRKDQQRLGFLVALSLGAVVLGLNDKYMCKVPRWEANAYLNTHTALSLLTSIFCLATYGSDQPVFLRDRGSGQNVFAYWLSRQIVDVFDLVLQTFTFTAIYFVIFQPHVGFFWYIFPFNLVTWSASGWGYVISTLVPPEHGAFITALLIFVVCGLFGNPANLQQFFANQTMETFVSCVSITRWSVGMSFLWANDSYPEDIFEPVGLATFNMEYTAYTSGWGGEDKYWEVGRNALLLMGLVLRVLSLLLLTFMPRNRSV